MNNMPENPKSPLRAPSPRVTAALAAAMLAIGVAVGAAIGPAPSASFAVGQLVPLLPSLSGAGAKSSTTAVQPPAVTPQATPPATAESSAGTSASSTTPESTATSPTSSSETPTPSSTTPTSTSKGQTTTLPPITHVWLIELAGSTFTEAAAQPSAAPYIDTQAVPAGTLLGGWSGLAGSAFAGEAALADLRPVAGTPPQLLDTIVQPPCPEGAAGAQCAADTPGALSAADEFLKASVPTITATTAYRESGLIVVTFGSIVAGSATGLPSGASSATLTSQPPAGVLLISPFASAGVRPSTAFNPASPTQSLEKLLHD
jgi:hypothetical protein